MMLYPNSLTVATLTDPSEKVLKCMMCGTTVVLPRWIGPTSKSGRWNTHWSRNTANAAVASAR